jgi:hypothetical protein
MAYHNVDWETCADGCIGVRLPTGGKCWAHAEGSDLDAALDGLRHGGQLDARGVPITDELLNEMLAAAPQDELRRPVLTDARFHEATFSDDAKFSRAVFKGDSSFERAIFKDRAWFDSRAVIRPTSWTRFMAATSMLRPSASSSATSRRLPWRVAISSECSPALNSLAEVIPA